MLRISAMADTEFFEPNLFLYDACPGGIGFLRSSVFAHAISCSANPRAH